MTTPLSMICAFSVGRYRVASDWSELQGDDDRDRACGRGGGKIGGAAGAWATDLAFCRAVGPQGRPFPGDLERRCDRCEHPESFA